ncbi:MAG: hypothetical protein E7Z70_02135 [Thermoplasmata archaeon]|nr:hypothetical protein [Thermoplasmata archaeon]
MGSSPTLDYLRTMKYGIVSIVGSGKTFKSGTMYSLFDYVLSLKKRKKAFLHFSGLEHFPEDYGYPVDDLWDTEPDSILVIEDANRLFPSRASARSSDLQEFLGVISHKDILIFLTVQNTANTDMAFFRDQDTITIHKRMSSTAVIYERPEISSFASDANVYMSDYCMRTGADHHYVSYVPRFNEILYLDSPPSWYGWEQSHALRDYRPPKEVKD